ncbi:MAG: hypothetical protein ACM3X1_00930 [Ignavibacteriales bacterium]
MQRHKGVSSPLTRLLNVYHTLSNHKKQVHLVSKVLIKKSRKIHNHITPKCIFICMGRWENNRFADDDSFTKKRNYIRIIKYVIIAGFVIVAVVVLSVYISRSGLNVEIVERSEVMGTMQTVSVRVSNNNFDTLNDVSVQFGDGGQIQQIGDMGPFSSVMITPPESTELNFTKVTVTANEGEIQVTKSR